MHVANHRPPPQPDVVKVVHLPEDAELSRLLSTAKGPAYLGLTGMALAASPAHPDRSARFPAPMVNIVTGILGKLLQTARAAGDPAADALAAFLAREFGIREAAP